MNEEILKFINALRKCAKEHKDDRTSTGHIVVYDLCRDTANLLEQLEQEPRTNNITIPKDATNGDAIKAMFPNCEQKEHMNNGYFEMYFDTDFRNASYMRVHKYWWRASYQNKVSE